MPRSHSRNPHKGLAAILVALAVALSLAVAAPLARAEEPKEYELTDEDRAALERVTDYFNRIKDIHGEFVQIGPGSHLAEGEFYLSKPGKLRFEYAPPNPLLVVADGTWVIINNRRLQTADHYPISATPLRVVLAEEVNLLEEAKIIHLYQDPTLMTVTLEDKSMLVPGRLTLVFDNEKMELQQWIIVDGQGNQITISLKNMEVGEEPDPELFVVNLPNEIPNIER